MIIGPKEDKMGMRASDTVPLTFEDCRVPAGNLLGELNRGFNDTLKVLERGRIHDRVALNRVGPRCAGGIAPIRDRTRAVRQADRTPPGNSVHARRHGDGD